MSAWYIFSALGFYPAAGTDRYSLGSPAVKSAEIILENGNKITVSAVNNSDKNVYVSELTVNGETYTKREFTHDEIINGGQLIFKMTDKPTV